MIPIFQRNICELFIDILASLWWQERQSRAHDYLGSVANPQKNSLCVIQVNIRLPRGLIVKNILKEDESGGRRIFILSLKKSRFSLEGMDNFCIFAAN